MSTVVLALLLGVAVTGLVIVFLQRRARDAAMEELRHEGVALAERMAALAKYQVIVDAEGHAGRVITEAEAKAARLMAEAQQRGEGLWAEAAQSLAQARSDSEAARARADLAAGLMRSKAAEFVADARLTATRVVDEARSRAQQVAGEAFAAMENIKQLELTERAMRNVIEGYGDRYLVPTFSLLDDLAEEFGFTEAGQCLKTARERVRDMVRNEAAAACDYAEPTRRATAIEFVLDAFNGKVDTILADVRHDNYGTLAQKVKDSFALVNKNGEAFRRARITDIYLEARLDELRWAVLVHELKLKEREEQRAIKERIRDEERAQREFEKAMRDAEREEDLLRRAMEKARAQVAKASDEQKVKYEEQLRDLSERLSLAEEKNRRAISMAQQTRAGHVYVISNTGSFGEDVHKIGLTRRLDPNERIRELGDASVPFDFDVHALIYSEDAPSLERELHRRFVKTQVNKVNARKEFFRIQVKRIREEVERLGCQVAWTLAAEAREYRETIAIELAMKDNTLEVGAWAERQIQDHDAALTENVSKEAVG